MKYKLGLDLGSTSLGWAVIELDDNDKIIRLVDMGGCIFPDGRDAQTHTPINVKRRDARGMRRRGDRLLLRKKRTLQLIKKYGLNFDIRSDPRLEDPYALRVKALSEILTPSELGRVMFHLALRRGFKSNRKETRGESGGKLKKATETLKSSLENKTLAQFQYESKKYRFANQFDGVKIKDGALYPTRDMYKDEFDKICYAQNLPEQMRKDFENAIFYQRPLVTPHVGNCLFVPDEKRAYKYEPAFQKWRVLQQLNQLRILSNGEDASLTEGQYKKLYCILLETFDGVKREKNGKVKITFAEIKKQLELKRSVKFNLESEKRKEMDVDTTAFAFFEKGEQEFWNSLTGAQKSEILAKVNDDKIEDDDLIHYLTDNHGLSSENAEKISQILLEDDVANVSLVAINKMLPFLEKGQLYHEAAAAAGFNHSEKDIPSLDFLPYYGDLMALRPSLVSDRNGFYRTMNATVHIAMNQIRAVVNDLIKHYEGKPYAITIEMGRDVRAGAEERGDIEKRQVQNKKENDRISGELLAMGETINRENIQKYKLWEALGTSPLERRCVYTNEIISKEKLFSPEFEVEHILPFSRTLDDSMANKTISRVDANRFKGSRSPDEAFGDPASPWDYMDVWTRAQSLSDATRWRFNKGALEKFLKERGPIDRALNDTRHMTTMAVMYLKHVCEDKYRVNGLPGQMTALFRGMWHLDWWKDKADAEKYRGSHIHHAIDAFVVACAGEERFRRLQTNSKNPELYSGKILKEKHKVWFEGMELPFQGFDYYDFKMRCENTIISYRKSIKDPRENGTIGKLHEDTAYNLEEFENGVKAKMSHRISLPTTTKGREKFKKDFQNVNEKTRQMFCCSTGICDAHENQSGEFLDWCRKNHINKVRTIKTGVDVTTYIPIFRTKTDRKSYQRAYEAWYIATGISVGIKNRKAKRNQKDTEDQLLKQYQTAALRAYKWYIGGNNFCADIFAVRADDKRYPKDAGKWQIEIVSNYAAEQNGGMPMWRKKYATAKRLMTLRINDMLMAEFSKNDPDLPKGLIETVLHQCALEQKDVVNIVFRVKSLDSSGKVWMRPHFIAKEDKNTKTWTPTASSLQEHKARKIHVNSIGEILKEL